MNTIIGLHGMWNYELDEEDKGIQQEWHQRTLTSKGFVIPGTTASNHIGNPVQVEKTLSKDAVRCLREEYKYLGAAWYQTNFCIDKKYEKKRIVLFLERVMFESSIWIDNHYIGKQDSLSTPHTYDLTEYITYGLEQRLTIRIDNRDIQKLGPNPSAYTDETQTIWNGIVGRVEIQAEERVVIENIVSGVMLDQKEISVSFDLCNDFRFKVPITLEVRIKKEESILISQVQSITISSKTERAKIILPLTDQITLWDEFEPMLYTLEIIVSGHLEGRSISGIFHKQIGFRQLDHKDGILRVNGIQRFLRGNIDCCVYPYTGYPPMDLKSWKEFFATTKAYGLNHVRFHSWCPPEAAFEAADQLGVYLQVEGPVWMDDWTGYLVGSYEEHYRYLPKEAKRIIDTYSIHPSFCIYSNGNELNGDFKLLEKMIEILRERNPYLFYTLSTNWDRTVTRQDDLFIAQSVEGTGIRGQFFLDALVTGTSLDFLEGVQKRKIPVLSHEVGQYAVYPNVSEISKYTGVLKPINLEVIKKDLEEKNLLSYLPDFVRASGNLAWLLYKAELEAALRTKGLAGTQLLGLHDFPGQSTATVGLLDCFMDSKGIGSVEDFLSFCNKTVVLVKMEKFIYKTSEKFVADIEIAHYGKKALRDVEIVISLEDNEQNIVWTETFQVEEVPIGLYSGYMHIKTNIFSGLKGRNSFVLKAGILNTSHWNSWNIWVYEEEPFELNVENCYDNLNEEAILKLQQGENVVLMITPNHISQIGPSKFFPVFWSPVHFESINPCGMIIDNKHPLFEKYFTTKNYADHEWKNILESGVSINLDSLAGYQPITMFVPNFYNNHKYSNLFEAKVLNGKVMICCLDLDTNAKDCIEMKSLKCAIIQYFVSEDFNPEQRVELEDLKALFKTEEEA
ncbi:MAG: sugar-binding domain-containing protein [Mobilitalea sp.]